MFNKTTRQSSMISGINIRNKSYYTHKLLNIKYENRKLACILFMILSIKIESL